LPEAASSPERYTLAVITDHDLYPEIRRHLGQGLRTVMASAENEIKNVLEQAGTRLCSTWTASQTARSMDSTFSRKSGRFATMSC